MEHVHPEAGIPVVLIVLAVLAVALVAAVRIRRTARVGALALALVVGLSVVALAHTPTRSGHWPAQSDCEHSFIVEGPTYHGHRTDWSSSWPYWNWTVKQIWYTNDGWTGWRYSHTHSYKHWGDPPCV